MVITISISVVPLLILVLLALFFFWWFFFFFLDGPRKEFANVRGANSGMNLR